MLKKLGSVLFYSFISLSALALSNQIAMRYYGKPLIVMLVDFGFLATL